MVYSSNDFESLIMETFDTKDRDTTFDSIKFVLITLVFLGHTFKVNWDAWGNVYLFSFIYSFHMPAFVLISGYFYKDSNPKKFWRNILELLIVILVFQIIYFSSNWFDPYDFSFKGIINRLSRSYLPIRALWYLLSLCFWRIFMYYSPKNIRENYKIALPLSIFLSLFVGFLSLGSQFSFQRTFTFFPYFLLGYYIHKYSLWKKIRNIRIWKCIVVILLYFIVILMIPSFPDSMLFGSFHYWTGVTSWDKMFALRILSYFWTLPLTFCVLSVIPNCKFFAKEGKNTVFYLLYHPYFVWLIHFIVTRYHIPSSSPFLILYIIIGMFFMCYLCKMTLLNFLTKPITMLRKQF